MSKKKITLKENILWFFFIKLKNKQYFYGKMFLNNSI